MADEREKDLIEESPELPGETPAEEPEPVSEDNKSRRKPTVGVQPVEADDIPENGR